MAESSESEYGEDWVSEYESNWESEYESNWESEYESNWESEYESSCESKNESEDELDIQIYTKHGHRKPIFYEVIDLTFGHPVRKPIDFETRCPYRPTSWKGEIELERAENNGSVSYAITINRTDDKDEILRAVVQVFIFDNAAKKLLFYRRWFEGIEILPGDELRDSYKDAISAQAMQNLQENKLMLEVHMIVSYCHGKKKRKRESDSDN